jgi:hypothetical protein
MDREQQLDEVITTYLKAVDAGERIDQAEWLQRYPDLADDLAEFFASQQSVERVAAPLRDAGAMPARQNPSGDAPTLPPPSQGGFADSAQPGDRIRYFGDYELLDEIARGGMGVVYRARQASLNRTVALKMILAGQFAGTADVERFRREAEAAAGLDHPNLVPIYEIGEHGGQHYFSMKLIDGVSLARRAADFVRDPKAAVHLLAKVARAVHDAHQHGILHRDLKPSNILLDARGEPYVGDFGLAKHVDGRHPQTRTGAIVGTPSYMAPEQARSQKALTVAVDVYGLGAILYELLTGRPPFRAENELETVLQVLDRDPPRPRAVNPRIDRDLETICLKCLEKAPRSRYNSALALAEDLERWLAGHTIQARPSGPVRRVWKWAKRNPTLAVLLVVLPLWYFNVRLPWQWAWLWWIWFAVFVLLSLRRVVQLCGRAVGRLPGKPWVWSADDLFLPATALAMLVLGFYPAELADRKALAFALIVTPILWNLVIQWLRRRARAGPLSLAIRAPLPLVIVFALCFGMFTIAEMVELIQGPGPTRDLLAHVGARIQTVSTNIWLFLVLCVGIEFRKQGCLTFFRFARWEEIESAEWKPSGRDYLLVTLKLRDNPLGLFKTVPRGKKENVDRVLAEHGLQVKQDAPPIEDASQPLPPGERPPADRIAGPALLLLCSAIMQIGVAAFLAVLCVVFANIGTEQVWVISPIALLVGVVGGVSGAIVLAGALKMRRLIDHRFCRMSAIVAMLPLGAGFPLGLPFGIWALLVLRRSDVKAAFAGGRR